MNNSTTLTLNDRFSMIKQTNGFPTQQGGRGLASRSRSRSRGRQQQGNGNLRGSNRNRKLLDQLEKQHKMRLALKLKNKSILRSRGRAQGQIIRNNARRAGTIKKAVSARNLMRMNSLTTFVPLNDTPRRNNNFRGRSRSRSQSRNRMQPTGSIIDRLGVRAPPRRMRRGPPQNNNGAQQQRSRSRPRSRVRLNRNNFNNRNGNNQAPMKRSNSINARLGNAGSAPIRRRRGFATNTRNPNTQLNKPLGGRIVKRNPRNPAAGRVQRNVRKNANQLGENARNGVNARRGGKIIKRGNNVQAQDRGRARNRGPGNQAGQGAGRRGRSRTKRGPNNNRGGAGGNISKSQLDKQLDDYMSKGSA